MRKSKTIFITILLLMVLIFSGCREADRVSRNISRNADNFNVIRRLTVFNMRTDKCILCMTGKMSIQNEGNNELAVIVEVDRDAGLYQKHFVYLNEWTMYTVEDVSGVNVSRYAYEIEFMPQMIVPIKVTAEELKQDLMRNETEEEQDATDGLY